MKDNQNCPCCGPVCLYTADKLPPRKWDSPPLWVCCIGMVLIAATIIFGLSIMGSIDNLEEVYHIKRADLPLGFAFGFYLLAPFAVTVVFAFLSMLCVNARWYLYHLCNNRKSKTTFKFRNNG